ncbi:MAG: DsbA family protein [Pseudomonadales bacterium]|nr:DsbA family protein [Pseudomonadales bacterium]
MLEIKEQYAVNVNLRMVLPIALRNPDVLFKNGDKNNVRYIMLDWARRAEFLGLPHQWPSPDPIVQERKTMQIAEQQPYIYRLSKLGVEAQRRGQGIEFAEQVSRLIWGGTRAWDKRDHLKNATKTAGLSLERMEAEIGSGNHMTEIEQNHTVLENAGHWGAPTFVYKDEPFFGQDRIDTLCWRLDPILA